jgi:hypothetical protein
MKKQEISEEKRLKTKTTLNLLLNTDTWGFLKRNTSGGLTAKSFLFIAGIYTNCYFQPYMTFIKGFLSVCFG